MTDRGTEDGVPVEALPDDRKRPAIPEEIMGIQRAPISGRNHQNPRNLNVSGVFHARIFLKKFDAESPNLTEI